VAGGACRALDVGFGNAQLRVEVAGGLDDGGHDPLICGAAIEIDAGTGKLGDGIDAADTPGVADAPFERGEVRHPEHPQAVQHATLDRRGYLAQHWRAQEGILGAGVGPARDDAGADDGARMGNMELARHEGAGREAGDRGGLEIGAERRQRDGLRAALREAGDAPEQDRKRSEDRDRQMQTDRSPAPVAQCMRNHARSYTPNSSRVISTNPDRRKAPATSAVS
jgi:hypothetical protein